MESKKQDIQEHVFDKEKLQVNTNDISLNLQKDDIKLEDNKTLKKNKKKRKLKIPKIPKRCQFGECKKKLDLVKIQCKCDLYFCSKHRLNHNCTYDYKKNSKINQQLLEGDSNFKKLEKI